MTRLRRILLLCALCVLLVCAVTAAPHARAAGHAPEGILSADCRTVRAQGARYVDAALCVRDGCTGSVTVEWSCPDGTRGTARAADALRTRVPDDAGCRVRVVFRAWRGGALLCERALTL